MSPRFLKALSALWSVAAGTCCEVAHAHGDADHCHRLGVVSVASQDHETAGRHRHLILLGIETGGIPADADEPTDGGDFDITYGLNCGNVSAADSAQGAPFALPDTALTPCPLAVLSRHPRPSPATEAAIPSVCAKAARTRSGVRLA